MGGFVDERVLDVAEVQELVLAVTAFAVVSGEASAGTKRFTRLATRSAAAWALQTCPVVVYVTDDQLPLLLMLVRLAVGYMTAKPAEVGGIVAMTAETAERQVHG